MEKTADTLRLEEIAHLKCLLEKREQQLKRRDMRDAEALLKEEENNMMTSLAMASKNESDHQGSIANLKNKLLK